MKKTVEVEYVGIEDVQEIMDDAYALMRDGHYADVEFDNINPNNVHICVRVMLGGFRSYNGYDYTYNFYMSDKAEDVVEMNECKTILKNLLVEE